MDEQDERAAIDLAFDIADELVDKTLESIPVDADVDAVIYGMWATLTDILLSSGSTAGSLCHQVCDCAEAFLSDQPDEIYGDETEETNEEDCENDCYSRN